MIKAGTLCYTIGESWGENGLHRYAGSVVEVVGFGGTKSHIHPDCFGCEWYRVVAQDGRKFGAHRCCLRPISDPDADVSEWTGGKHPVEVTA